MNFDRFYVDRWLRVTTTYANHIAGPFETELEGRQWLDRYLDTKCDELTRILVGAEAARQANQDAMVLLADTGKDS